MMDNTARQLVETSDTPPASEEFPTLRELQARHIVRALHLASGNQRHAAEMLDVTRWTLSRLLQKYGLRTPRAATTAQDKQPAS